MKNRSTLALALALLAVAYYAAADLGLLLLSETNNIALVWPATAILLAYLHRRDVSEWPLALALCWGAGILANFTMASSLPLTLILLLTFTDVFVDGLLAAVLLRRFSPRTGIFDSVREASHLIVLSCLVAPAVGGLLGGGAIAVMFDVAFVNEWYNWWVSTAVNVSLLLPLLLLVSFRGSRPIPTVKQWAEIGAISLAVLGLSVLLLFTEYVGFLFLVVPILLWAALRFGVLGVSAFATLLAAATITITMFGHGPVISMHNDSVDQVHFLQIFLISTYIPTLLCAVAFRERSTIERALRQMQKMESLGTLASGIAHELNNMLVPITGLTQLAMEDVSENSRTRKNLGGVLQSAKRAGSLVDKILSFSRRDEVGRGPLDLRQVVEDGIELLGASLPNTISVKVELGNGSLAVLANETQLHQVIMNLTSNAVGAMDGKVGELTIGLSPFHLVDRRNCGRLGLAAGDYAKLSVRDTGCGMDQTTVDRIFEPFFTTKGVGKGTGMGLAITHGIITAHGGTIDVLSVPGAGATFDVYLPMLEEAELPQALNG